MMRDEKYLRAYAERYDDENNSPFVEPDENLFRPRCHEIPLLRRFTLLKRLLAIPPDAEFSCKMGYCCQSADGRGMPMGHEFRHAQRREWRERWQAPRRIGGTRGEKWADV